MGTLNGILGMRATLRTMEQIRDQQSAAQLASQPTDEEPIHYYHIERKIIKVSKRGKRTERWVFQGHVHVTPTRANELLQKHAADGEYRLIDFGAEGTTHE